MLLPMTIIHRKSRRCVIMEVIGKRWNNFLNRLCEDKYYVISKQSVTAKKFLATRNYLANYNDYPACCDRIIVYFVGHGKDGYIRLDVDYSDWHTKREGQ